MAVATGTALAIGGMAAVGGIAGSLAKKTDQEQQSHIDAGSATNLEGQGAGLLSSGMSGFQSMVNAGPGAQDVTAGLDSSRSLADMLKAYSQQGGANPNAQDISSSNQLASGMFQYQRTALGQNFDDQRVQASQQAALMGRSQNDPILRNKLAQEQTRQASLLDSQQGSWAQNYALQQPMQRLGFASQRNDVLGGLASQALANRQAMASMGAGVMGAERNFRVQTGTHYGSQTQSSGGGLQGGLMGALAGAGAGASLMTGFGGMSGGGAAGAAAPSMGSYFSNANPYSGGGLSMPASQLGFGGFGAQQAPSLFGGNYAPLSNQFLGMK